VVGIALHWIIRNGLKVFEHYWMLAGIITLIRDR